MSRHNTPAGDAGSRAGYGHKRRGIAVSTRGRARNRADAEILRCLANSDRPMRAYDVLDELRPAGINSPPTV